MNAGTVEATGGGPAARQLGVEGCGQGGLLSPLTRVASDKVVPSFCLARGSGYNEQMNRPVFDRQYFEVLSADNAPDAADEWATRSPIERIAAALFLRETMYGKDHVAARIPRVFEVLRAPWCEDAGVRGIRGESSRPTEDDGRP